MLRQARFLLQKQFRASERIVDAEIAFYETMTGLRQSTLNLFAGEVIAGAIADTNGTPK